MAIQCRAVGVYSDQLSSCPSISHRRRLMYQDDYEVGLGAPDCGLVAPLWPVFPMEPQSVLSIDAFVIPIGTAR